jgi:hypothetical protein
MPADTGLPRARVWLPTGVVIVALLAPAFLPWVLRWREQAIARELQEVNTARPLAEARRAAFEWTAATRGLGLGLPIVKGLVEAHGSRIIVTSREGEGTTFSFSIRRLC